MRRRSLIKLVWTAVTSSLATIVLMSVLRPPSRAVFAIEREQLVAAQFHQILPRFDVDAMPFDQAIAALAKQAGVDIEVDVQAFSALRNINVKAPVTVHVTNLNPSAVLHEIIKQQGSSAIDYWSDDDGTIRVTTTSQTAMQAVTTRIYDIHGLLAEIVGEDSGTWNGTGQPFIEMSSPVGPLKLSGPINLREARELIESRITDTVETDSWRTKGGTIGQIDSWGECLIVTQTPRGQALVEAMLGVLQQSAAKRPATEQGSGIKIWAVPR